MPVDRRGGPRWTWRDIWRPARSSIAVSGWIFQPGADVAHRAAWRCQSIYNSLSSIPFIAYSLLFPPSLSSPTSQAFLQSLIEASLRFFSFSLSSQPHSLRKSNQPNPTSSFFLLTEQVSSRLSQLSRQTRNGRKKSVKMVKISPLVASMLLGLAAALPQQGAPSGTGGFGGGPKPTGTGLAFPSGTGGFGGPGGPEPTGAGGFGGPRPSGGPQPSGAGPQPSQVAGNAFVAQAEQSGAPQPTGGTCFPPTSHSNRG